LVALCRDDLVAKITPAERGSIDEAPEESVELALKKWELLEDNSITRFFSPDAVLSFSC